MKRAGVCLRVLLLAVAVCWTIGTRAQESERRVALVIGNAGYQHVDRLANPGNDAKLIADTLRRSGFTLVGGGAQRDLDKATFDRLVREFGQQIQGAEVALFYYAGHGIQVQGSNWLLPVDANPTRPQDLDFQLVNAELVLKQMDGAGTRLNIVLLDACRNNPFANLGTRGIGSGLAQMRAPEGTLISFATQPGNVAVDGTGADGPYATALADAIRQPGLDIFHLFNQVGLRVKRDTQGSQQPWVSSSPIDGDFYFAHSEAAPDVMGVPMLETPPSVQAGASRDAAGGAKPAPAQTADTDRPLRDLAEKGQPQAQTDLGLLYAKGFGVEKDYATAMQWFQRAAGQGLAARPILHRHDVRAGLWRAAQLRHRARLVSPRGGKGFPPGRDRDGAVLRPWPRRRARPGAAGDLAAARRRAGAARRRSSSWATSIGGAWMCRRTLPPRRNGISARRSRTSCRPRCSSA